jgi:membrane protein
MKQDETIGFGKELVDQFKQDDASGMAAELAYRWLFAVFPFGLFLAALGAFVAAALGVDNPAQKIIDGLGDNLPAGLASGIQPELERVIGQQRPGLASIGALAALWAATSGTMTVIKAMNRAYGVDESRSAIKKYGIGIGLTLAGAVGLLVSFVTIVGGSLLTQQVAEQLGLGSTAWAVVTIARWPAVFALLVLAVAVVLRIGPNMTPSWRSSLLGGVVFAVGWLAATGGFALYIANFANYGATYGALAGVIVLMMWFYLTALVLVAAGEIVALLTKRTEPERLEERREAIRADIAGTARKVTEKVKEAATSPGLALPRTAGPERRSRTARRPAAPSTAAAVATPGQAREMPARVVAVIAAIVAVTVGWATTRLARD